MQINVKYAGVQDEMKMCQMFMMTLTQQLWSAEKSTVSGANGLFNATHKTFRPQTAFRSI